MRRLLPALDAGRPRAFYDEVEDALLGFARDRLGVAGSDLSRRNIRSALLGAGAGEDTADRFDALLERCEVALYAGQTGAEDMASTYADARRLMTEGLPA